MKEDWDENKSCSLSLSDTRGLCFFVFSFFFFFSFLVLLVSLSLLFPTPSSPSSSLPFFLPLLLPPLSLLMREILMKITGMYLELRSQANN